MGAYWLRRPDHLHDRVDGLYGIFYVTFCHEVMGQTLFKNNPIVEEECSDENLLQQVVPDADSSGLGRCVC